MTTPKRPISEDDLHAYVDGVLDEDRHAAIESYLQSHPEIGQRVASYVAQRADLRAAFAAPALEPIPPQLNLSSLVEERLRFRPQRWVAAAAAVLALAIGAGGGWFLGSRPPAAIATLSQEAAAGYAVFVSAHSQSDASPFREADALVGWVAHGVGRSVKAPDLAKAGYRLLGAALVPAAHGSAAMLHYRNAHGTSLVIYIRPVPAGGTTPLEAIDIGTIDGCAWIDRGLGYSLIAAEPYGRLVDLSQQVREESAARGS
ncbi:MAG TPA: anti-sigma factor [Acetobacteraceae bacterium]|nr:anti-sigma factor [Acetobacteraceae bacterium]